MAGLWGEDRGHIRMLGGQGCQLSQEPHPKAETSESCLPPLATGGLEGGSLHLVFLAK